MTMTIVPHERGKTLGVSTSWYGPLDLNEFEPCATSKLPKNSSDREAAKDEAVLEPDLLKIGNLLRDCFLQCCLLEIYDLNLLSPRILLRFSFHRMKIVYLKKLDHQCGVVV